MCSMCRQFVHGLALRAAALNNNKCVHRHRARRAARCLGCTHLGRGRRWGLGTAPQLRDKRARLCYACVGGVVCQKSVIAFRWVRIHQCAVAPCTTTSTWPGLEHDSHVSPGVSYEHIPHFPAVSFAPLSPPWRARLLHTHLQISCGPHPPMHATAHLPRQKQAQRLCTKAHTVTRAPPIREVHKRSHIDINLLLTPSYRVV